MVIFFQQSRLDRKFIKTLSGSMEMDEKDVIGLIENLNDLDWDVRNYIADILVKIGEPAIDPLIKALKNDDLDIRMEAARVLGRIGNKKALNPLIGALKDEDVNFRKQAASAINKIIDKGTVPK
jgi:HEAT repeat protein